MFIVVVVVVVVVVVGDTINGATSPAEVVDVVVVVVVIADVCVGCRLGVVTTLANSGEIDEICNTFER